MMQRKSIGFAFADPVRDKPDRQPPPRIRRRRGRECTRAWRHKKRKGKGLMTKRDWRGLVAPKPPGNPWNWELQALREALYGIR